jgi:4-hydroxy-4-methyl-2-oxoglutarate aldolase
VRHSPSTAVPGRALPPSTPDELRTRFDAVYTAALTDVMDDLGRRHQTLPPEVVPLEPGARVAGPAFAVEGRTNHAIDPEISIRRILEMLGSVPAGHVAVYEAGDTTCAHFGELSAVSLVAHGVAGIVINGGCRDVDLVNATGLPVFARYRTPQDAVSRWEVLEWGNTIVIEGVTIATGDYVVGDADGVAVIPHDLIEPVLVEAEALVGTENLIRDAVRDGMKPLAAYDEFGKF